eukprot:1217109-Prorocentrum_lima.AAC.1
MLLLRDGRKERFVKYCVEPSPEKCWRRWTTLGNSLQFALREAIWRGAQVLPSLETMVAHDTGVLGR